MNESKHTWSFSVIGGIKRVNLENGADLVHLEELDQKLWTALSCPVKGLEIDTRTLELIDSDCDGHIRVPEILSAVKWMVSLLKNPDNLLNQSPEFPLSALRTDIEEGKRLLSSAKIILENLAKPDAAIITACDTADTLRIFSASRFNGDGIIIPETSDNPKVQQLIREIMSCLAPLPDRSGNPGVDENLVRNFFLNCQDYAAWMDTAQENLQEILPFGNETPAAWQLYQRLKPKIEDFFLRCRLSAYNPTSSASLNLQTEKVDAISGMNLIECLDEISTYPLAQIAPKSNLSLTTGLNPAWESAMHEFCLLVCNKLFPGILSLSENEWKQINIQFQAFENWQNQKKGYEVECLGIERIRQITESKCLDDILKLINEDKALEQEMNSIIVVDKLVRYYRDLFTLLKNFVTFSDFYSPGIKAIFQAGTLFIDQRSCDLCLLVNDMSKHAGMVSFSGMYLLYCNCVSRAGSQHMTIVAALTNGNIDNLVVGRNALFYDRSGQDWDATVIKIVENHINIRQAFWSPYRRVQRFIETQVNKFAAANDEKVMSDAKQKISVAHSQVETLSKAPPSPFDIGKFVGIFAAISLAIGAIGTAIASVITGFMDLSWWKMPLALMGLMLIISGPSMIMAFINLRKRNLAPLLDANGWAINARATVNIPFGKLLTQIASLPKGSKLNLNDPFTKKERHWFLVVFSLIIVAGAVLFMLWKYEIFKIHF